ncbi:hypothetical protein F895_02621 [Acinetobacter sp. CIP 64.2]|nr:hypothetical protein F895_02621 [Acinetobacter sp. CIP 64.2]
MYSQQMLSGIRKLPCVVCGNLPVSSTDSNHSAYLKGVTIKLGESLSIPLCRNHHIEFNQFQKMNRSLSIEWFNQMLEKTEQMLQT